MTDKTTIVYNNIVSVGAESLTFYTYYFMMDSLSNKPE